MALPDGAVVVVVSDGILNAYRTPEIAVLAVATVLEEVAALRASGARTKCESLLSSVAREHSAMAIIRAAEVAAFEKHVVDPSHFSRDDMSVAVVALTSVGDDVDDDDVDDDDDAEDEVKPSYSPEPEPEQPRISSGEDSLPVPTPTVTNVSSSASSAAVSSSSTCTYRTESVVRSPTGATLASHNCCTTRTF